MLKRNYSDGMKCLWKFLTDCTFRTGQNLPQAIHLENGLSMIFASSEEKAGAKPSWGPLADLAFTCALCFGAPFGCCVAPARCLALYREGCPLITTLVSLVVLATWWWGLLVCCCLQVVLGLWATCRGELDEKLEVRADTTNMDWSTLMINVLQNKKGVVCPYWFCWHLQILSFVCFHFNNT